MRRPLFEAHSDGAHFEAALFDSDVFGRPWLGMTFLGSTNNGTERVQLVTVDAAVALVLIVVLVCFIIVFVSVLGGDLVVLRRSCVRVPASGGRRGDTTTAACRPGEAQPLF